MIQKDFLKEIIRQQEINLHAKEEGMIRDSLCTLPDIDNYALIVSGVRRCGKSTLLHQLLKKKHTESLYINFDDPRLYDFEISDFQKLDQLIAEAGNRVLMFDEIQIIKGWERYVRQKLDENFKVFVTGSNASLLSKELGTRHRAGVGISEVTDSLTVIVSEETGKISVAYEGKLERNLDAETLRDRMHKILNNTGEEHKNLRIWKGRSREKK